MKAMQVFKMLLKHEEWKYVTPFKCDPTMIEVTHKSGIFYYKNVSACVIRFKVKGILFEVSLLSMWPFAIAAYFLERKLNK